MDEEKQAQWETLLDGISSFDVSCRLCAKSNRDQTPIFNGSNLPQKITACLGIRVYKNDKLPQNICVFCENLLDMLHVFKEQCQEIDAALHYCISAVEFGKDQVSTTINVEKSEVKRRGRPPGTPNKKRHSHEDGIEVGSKRKVKKKLSVENENGVKGSPGIDDLSIKKKDIQDIEAEITSTCIKNEEDGEDLEALLDKQNASSDKKDEKISTVTDQEETTSTTDNNNEASKTETAKHRKPKIQWTRDQLLKALNSVMKDCMSDGEASKTYGIPRSTLRSYISRSYEKVKENKKQSSEITAKTYKKSRLTWTRDEHLKATNAVTKDSMSTEIESEVNMSGVFEKDVSSGSHKKLEVEERHFKCAKCEKIIKSDELGSNYKDYCHCILTHTCPICNKCFKTKGYAIVHMARHTGHYKYKCAHCNVGFLNQSHLKKHFQTNCSRNVSTSAQKVIRKVTTPVKKMRKKVTEVNKKRIRMAVKSKVKQVATVKTGQTATSQENGVNIYQCNNCPKHYLIKTSLQRHLKSHDEKKYKCDICRKCFRNPKGLFSHLLKHTQGDNK